MPPSNNSRLLAGMITFRETPSAVCVRTSSVKAALVTTSKLRSYLKSSPGSLMISSRSPSRSASGSESRNAASSTMAVGVIVTIELVTSAARGLTPGRLAVLSSPAKGAGGQVHARAITSRRNR